MRIRLVVVLALIVISPLAVGGWLGAKIIRDQRLLVEHRTRSLALGQLRAVADDVAEALDRYRDTVMDDVGDDPAGAERSPYVRHYFRLGPDGGMVHPPLDDPRALTDAQRDALERTAQVWASGALREARPESESSVPSPGEAHWHSWYWGDGLQWMLWVGSADGGVLAYELDRARLLAEVVVALPDTDPAGPDLGGRLRLVDAAAGTLYQWGEFEPSEGSGPVETLALGAPVAAWTLEFHAPEGALGALAAGGLVLNLVAGITLLAVAVLVAAVWLYREHSRDLREAEQRVSFVNHVSHELKTPLTNIRMYAEMLRERLDDDGDSRGFADVVVDESRRLSRLIGNVLTFSRQQRDVIEIRRRPGVVDEVVESCLDHFRPALDAKGITVERELAATRPASFDPDALEQILGNLIGNVEKYAASGGKMRVRTEQHGAAVAMTVSDAGPGIPPRERERVFRPFYRAGNDMTEGVAGTGIGLSIARDLARRHGGELDAVPAESGACFRLTLDCPPAPGGNA